jgi:hypothetical protein
LDCFHWALPKPIHFFVLKQRSKQEIRRGEQGFILSFPPLSELFSLAKLRPFGRFSRQALNFPKGSRILLHKNNQIK